MTGLINLAAAGVCTASLIFSGVSAPTTTNNTQVKFEKILSNYVSGVTKDTDKYLYNLAVEIDQYLNGNNKAWEAFKKNPTPSNARKFAKEMERRAENFADVMEAVSEAYGELQEKNGEAFGEKFDDDTAKAITDLVLDILGYAK